MWSVVFYMLSFVMYLFGISLIYFAWQFRFKHIGLDLGAICYLAGATGAVTLEKWWPLIVAFILAWMVRLWGGDPGYK